MSYSMPHFRQSRKSKQM